MLDWGGEIVRVLGRAVVVRGVRVVGWWGVQVWRV